MQIADIHYMVGLIEGEGCLVLHRGKYPRVTVAMTDKDVVEKAARLFKSGTMYSRATMSRNLVKAVITKPIWTTLVTGGRAVGWMLTIYSLMGQRRQKKIRDIVKKWKVSKITAHTIGRRALCHPDRKHAAHDLCSPCASAARVKK